MTTDVLGTVRRWWWRRGHARFYATAAGRTDVYALNTGSAERFQALVGELSALLAPQPSDTVVDLGGGNGRLAAAVFARCRKLVLLDLCAPAPDGSPLVVADMGRPPFRPQSFTTLFSYSTFPHVGSAPNARRLLARWTELLRPGGLLFVGDIPDRARIPVVIRRGLHRVRRLNGLKYYVAVSMISYFSRASVARWLLDLGYEVRVLDQSPARRFARERFDVLARKPVTAR